MKSKLLLSLLTLSFLPAQLSALVITVTKFKNNAGKSITLLGNITDPVDSAMVSHFKSLTNKQQNELIAYLKGQKNVQVMVDQENIHDALHALNPFMIKDDIQYEEFCDMQLPDYGLEFFTLEHYQILLKKCADLEDSITVLGNQDIKQKFTALHSLLKEQENALRHFQTYRTAANHPADIPLGEVMDYENLIWNLRTIQMEIARYIYLVSLVTATAQHSNVYAYIQYEHIYGMDDSILSLDDFKNLGYDLSFEKKPSLENCQEGDQVKTFNALAIDLKDVLNNAVSR